MQLKVFSGLTKTVAKASLKISKHSPELLLVAGSVGVVATVIVACKKTLKAEEILDRHHSDMEVIKESKEDNSYTEADERKETLIVYGHTIGDMAKLYLPVAALGAVSMGCIFASYGILKKRNLALVAAYNAVSEAYERYKKKVSEEYGEEAGKKLVAKAVADALTETVVDENGEEKLAYKPATEYSEYAKFFDQGSCHWEKDPNSNFSFLRAQMTYANNILHSRHHLFLNEVYDMLDIPRTPAGAVVGWVEGNGDNYVDFGIYDEKNWKTRDFVNGYENVVLLDFNVDGVIYDKI